MIANHNTLFWICFHRIYTLVYLLLPRSAEEGRIGGVSERRIIRETECEGRSIVLGVITICCDSNYLWLAGKLTID